MPNVNKRFLFALFIIFLTTAALVLMFALEYARNDNDGGGTAQVMNRIDLDRAALQRLINEFTPDIIPDNEIGLAYLRSLNEAREVSSRGITQEEIDQALDSLLETREELLRYIVQPDAPKRNNPQLLSGLFIYGVKCAYDEQSGTFYFPFPAETGGYVNYRDFSYSSGLNGPVIIMWGNAAPKFGAVYTLKAVSSEYAYTYSLIFTGIPIVQISGITDAAINNSSLRPAGFSLIYHDDAIGAASIESAAQIRHRGAISLSYPKKSFAVKLADAGGRNNISLLGMRRASSWILDAMYIDRSKMRERVSMDIWNSIGTPLAHDKIPGVNVVANGTRGEYVEVFINNEYWGLYCLTETINRQQLGLQRYARETGVRSVTYKSEQWSDSVLFTGYVPYNSNSNQWDNYRQDFPDPRQGLPVFWEPLYNLVRFTVDSSDAEFAAGIANLIDIDNFVDYTIFQALTNAIDNTGKNIYWSVYDITDPEFNKFFITPWDLDATWGDSWNFDRIEPYDAWSLAERDNRLFRRLTRTNAGGFRDKLEAKWAELKTAQLSHGAIKSAFDKYFTLFEHTGAWQREMDKWQRRQFRNDTLQSERDYIFNWIDIRWAIADRAMTNVQPR